MSSLVYFGSKPSANQLISAENSLRNIRLCRAAPGTLNIVGVKEFTHPSYELYIKYLPLAIKAARTGTAVPTEGKEPFYGYNGKNVSPFYRNPSILWTYGEKKPSEFLDQQKQRFNAVETTAGGKPALLATLRNDQVISLIKDTSPLETTDFSVNAINIRAYRVYRRLHALAHSFLRVHQYALMDPSSKLTNDRARAMVAIDPKELETPNNWTHNILKAKVEKTQIYMNLPKPYATHQHCITRANDIPNSDGLIFPFVSTLSRDDPSTLLTILRNVFFGLLGDDGETAKGMYDEIVEGWKSLSITSWGHELTHLYVGMELALATGAAIRTFTTPSSHYAGFILSGSFFQVFVDGEIYNPQSFAVLQREFDVASPHSASLQALMAKINFPDDMTRQGQIAAVQSCADISVLIRQYGYNVNDMEDMKKHALKLNFPKDASLPLNATNLARVLTCMHSGVGEMEIPIHPVAIFKNSRVHRLISAFGVTCPSFIIKEGRPIELTGNFAVKKNIKSQGKVKEQSVNTMHVAMKSYEDACEDMDEVLKMKHVKTIAGTQNAVRVSARAMMREFDGNGGTEVLAALRQLAGVSVGANPSGSNEKKRKAEEEAKAETSKKVRQLLDDL